MNGALWQDFLWAAFKPVSEVSRSVPVSRVQTNSRGVCDFCLEKLLSHCITTADPSQPLQHQTQPGKHQHGFQQTVIGADLEDCHSTSSYLWGAEVPDRAGV